ncbi:transferrin receptor 1b isoform X2 [Syngnathus scovelli]|uniref:transferrin receptor 1b isoform X2 n=1 Tax=Syngnathus scovelli TaxID=161590 RepID=UPI0021100EBD|nr:transferrin receptor 1b isoform X2 [Syngnathus scovelli]
MVLYDRPEGHILKYLSAAAKRERSSRIKMDRVKSTFDTMLKSVRYSRFPTQRDEETNQNVMFKLSEDDDNAEVGPADGSPRFRRVPDSAFNGWRLFIILALSFLLVFAVGCLVGHFTGKKLDTESASCPTQSVLAGVAKEQGTGKGDDNGSEDVPQEEVPMSWNEISQLLDDKFTRPAFDERFKTFDVPSRSAGSEGDISLAAAISDEFKALDLETWSDVHYVQLQKPNSQRPNTVTFGSEVFKPTGYLAYSAIGKVEGKLVYATYGRRQDIDAVRAAGVEVNGSVLLFRAGAGKLTFAEQVANAEAQGALAVLIYPDPEDFDNMADFELYGHVHLGSGDPYTPGFPSFNHTQFPPTRSSALPSIPAQTITFPMATTLLKSIGGPNKMGGVEKISVEVNNELVNTKVHNVFAVLKGFIDPDQYVVLGAQRDAWGPGYARATVGCSVLMEMAKAFKDLVERDGVRPRRSVVFASWGAGEYGSVGATEFLEGYLSSIDRKLVTYISLDGVVTGRGGFVASASPMLRKLLEDTIKQVKSPLDRGTVYNMVGQTKWEANVLRPMSVDDPAYPFLAFAGVPSISFHFITPNMETYPYDGTCLDNADHLNYNTAQKTGAIAVVAAQLAGRMALRLVHDHMLSLDMSGYRKVLLKAYSPLYMHVRNLVKSGELEGVDPKWLANAYGSFTRAMANLNRVITNTDPKEEHGCRRVNEKLMSVERNLLSPYVSPVESPFRHLVLGRGKHTLAALAENKDPQELRIQLAFASWNLKMCAHAVVSDIWENDNQV